MGVYDPKKEETRWININATPLYNKGETKPFQVYSTFEDITERKKAEAALKSSQELFKKTFDSVSFAVSIVRASDNQIVDINEAYLRMVEYHKEEVVGHNAKELQVFPNYEEREKIAHLVNDGNQVCNQEIDVRTKSGKILRALFSVDLINFDNQPHFVGSLINITDRKKAEEALRGSEERLSLAQTLGNVGVWDWNTVTNELIFTPELEQLYGLNPGTIKTYGDWRQLTHPDDIEKIEVEREQNIANHEPFDLEFRIFHKSGELRWLSAKGGAIYNDEGDVLRVLGVNTDITERKISENLKQELLEKEQQLTEELQSSNEELQSTTEELHKSNEELYKYSKLLSAIYELNPDAIVLTTVFDSKIIDCNQEYLNQIGYSREEVIGHTSKELNLISEITREAYIDETRGNERVTNFEGRIKRKDGSFIDVVYSTRQITVNNEPIILNIGHDITETRRVENSLIESEERFRALADNIPNLAWMADADGWIFWYNKQWYEYTGTTFEEMQGWGWQKVHHPDYVDAVTEEWSTKLLNGEAYDNIFPLKGKDGTYRWFLTRITPIKDKHGKIERWFGTNTDITERKDIEDESANHYE